MKKLLTAGLLILSSQGLADSSSETASSTWVEVTRVEPVMKTHTFPSNDPLCSADKPRRSEGFRALLEWDVLPQCQLNERQVTSHYRVYYEWAGREFSYTSESLPDYRVRINVDVAPM